MRNPLHITVIVMLALVSLFYFTSEQRQTDYREASARYLTTVLADISRWQADALKRHLAPEARAAITDEQLAALVDRYRVLGEFEQLGELELQRLSVLSGWFGGPTLLGYSGQARFSGGSAQLSATLKIGAADTLSLYNFNLSSPLLHAPSASR